MSAPIGYAPLVAVATVLSFFTNGALYLYASGVTEVPPLWWVIALAVLTAPFVLRHAYELSLPASPFVLWTIWYLASSLAWFAAYPPSEAADAELRRRVLVTVYLGIVWVLLQQSGALLAARRAVLVATLAGVCVNCFEFFQPGIFSSVSGRAAGLYINPNTSGAALVLGMVLSSSLLRRWLRIAFVLVVGVGVVATLSRAALLGWLVIAASLLGPQARAIGTARLAASVGLAALAAASAIAFVATQQDLERESPWAQALADRLGMFAAGDAEDLSTRERRELLDEALGSAAHRPLAGAGLGANRFLDRETGSHNQYLDHIVQHGVLGMSILPLLALALALGAAGEARSDALRFAVFILFWGIFSHNVLDEWYLLTTVAIQAAIGRESRVLRIPPRLRNEFDRPSTTPSHR